MPEVHSLLQLLRIERPPLGAANTPSIRQCRYAAIAETHQPLASAAQADPGLRSMGLERHAIIKMPADQAFPTDRRQSGIGVAMDGW